MGLKLKLNSGAFSGAIFPVDVDVAYDPDPAGDDEEEVVGSAYLFFDESVVTLVPGSISPGGSHQVGTEIIYWPRVTVPVGGAWTKLSAQFQWTNYQAPVAAFSAAFNAGAFGTANGSLTVPRPPVPAGTRLRSSD